MLQDSGDARKPAIFLVMECFQNYIALQCAFIINSANYKTNKSKLKSQYLDSYRIYMKVCSYVQKSSK